MKAVSVREFKAKFNSIISKKKEVIVTRRGKPIGIFHPIEYKEEMIIKERTEIGRKLIGLGESKGGKASEEHDKLIYKR